MRHRTIVTALCFGALVVAPQIAEASSHHEAPFVSKNPKDDGTDLYAFQSYESGRAGFVTLIANYQPLQDAYGGPNYFGMDTDALYEILIDNNGDGVEDLTFQFQFQTTLGGTGNAGFSLHIGPDDGGANVAVPFYNVGLIPNAANTGNSGALNVVESYTVNLVMGPRRTGTVMPLTNPNGGGTTFNKPADNVGAKSFGTTTGTPPLLTPGTPSSYAAYAQNFIYNGVVIPGCSATGSRVFVGQRAEGFAVNLGPTFDLVDAPASVVTNGGVAKGGYAAVANPLALKNVTSIAIEVPASCITESASQPVIGAWTTASVRQGRVVNPAATYIQPSYEGGAWVQVSRLGNPLVNEVVIGLPDKDKFNGSVPQQDAVNFASYVEYPTLPAVIDLVFGTDYQPTAFPRLDLVEAFLSGIPGVNAFPVVDGGPAPALAEMLHLNTALDTALATPVTAAGSQSRLGAALCLSKGQLKTPLLTGGCDPFGFPNGRRPVDDVVDLALDVVEGYLINQSTYPTQAPAYEGGNTVLFTDGVDQSAVPFLPVFPYLNTPNQGAQGDGT